MTALCKDFELVIDNSLDKERFLNSQTLTAAYAMDRHVTMHTNVPYGQFSTLYGTGVAGVAATAIFTGPGTQALEFSLANIAFPRKSPSWTAGRRRNSSPCRGPPCGPEQRWKWSAPCTSNDISDKRPAGKSPPDSLTS